MIESVTAAVARGLSTAGGRPVRLTAVVAKRDGSTIPIDVEVAGERLRAFAADTDDPAVLAWWIADRVIDIVQEDLYHGEPFPPCPGHAHPAVVEVCEDRAYLCCPLNRAEPLLYLHGGREADEVPQAREAWPGGR
ncbi:hypothetical protein [Streptomyces sp. NPDC097619]|uniref:hypothetical protein n=1 Tax=Streptomyces sp. NPDC097619 TaxID=3157228 RepID=UPI003325F2FB